MRLLALEETDNAFIGLGDHGDRVRLGQPLDPFGRIAAMGIRHQDGRGRDVRRQYHVEGGQGFRVRGQGCPDRGRCPARPGGPARGRGCPVGAARPACERGNQIGRRAAGVQDDAAEAGQAQGLVGRGIGRVGAGRVDAAALPDEGRRYLAIEGAVGVEGAGAGRGPMSPVGAEAARSRVAEVVDDEEAEEGPKLSLVVEAQDGPLADHPLDPGREVGRAPAGHEGKGRAKTLVLGGGEGGGGLDAPGAVDRSDIHGRLR